MKRLSLFLVFLLLLSPALAQGEEFEDRFEEAVRDAGFGTLLEMVALEPLLASFQILVYDPIVLFLNLVTEQTAASFEEGPTALQYAIVFFFAIALYNFLNVSPGSMLESSVTPLMVMLLVSGFFLYVSPETTAWFVEFLSYQGVLPEVIRMVLGLLLFFVFVFFMGPLFGFFIGLFIGLTVAGFGELIIRLFVMPILILYAFVDMLIIFFFGVGFTPDFIISFALPLLLMFSIVKELFSSLSIFSERTSTLLGLMTFIVFSNTGYNPILMIVNSVKWALSLMGILNGDPNIFWICVVLGIGAAIVMVVSKIITAIISINQAELMARIAKAELAKAQQEHLAGLYAASQGP